ncbi:MAG: hypothetical protein U0172_14065 [Nitrospiraceae bacterium]
MSHDPQKLTPHPGDSTRLAEDHAMRVPGLMAGTALMFIGFLNILLSISGGFEINVMPILLYFAGLAMWANAVVENATKRYLIMGFAVVCGLGFFHYGEVMFWHKQIIFWSTIIMVMFFIFRTSTPGD